MDSDSGETWRRTIRLPENAALIDISIIWAKIADRKNYSNDVHNFEEQ